MLTEPTMEKLHGLRLGAMATAWTAQREDPKMNDIDFDGRFGMLVDAEHLARDNKRVARALQEAKLRISNACIEDIDYAPKRELDRALVRQLGTCAWIRLTRQRDHHGRDGDGQIVPRMRLGAEGVSRRSSRSLPHGCDRQRRDLRWLLADPAGRSTDGPALRRGRER